MLKHSSLVLLTLASTIFAGCENITTQSIGDWIQETQANIKPNVKPIPEPKTFAPKSYNAMDVTDPFNNQKLLEALRRLAEEDSDSVALLAPERARRKEQLEDYPLDSIAMVGYLNQRAVPVGLVLVNGLLYQVKVGNYLGQNYGRILAISDTGMTLREIVQDASGEWIEKETNMDIQEGPSSSSGVQ